MGAITSTKFEGLGTVAVMPPKPLNGNTKRAIRRRWRMGYMVWAIAAEIGLSEWTVAKQLMADGEHLNTVMIIRNRRRGNPIKATLKKDRAGSAGL